MATDNGIKDEKLQYEPAKYQTQYQVNIISYMCRNTTF